MKQPYTEAITRANPTCLVFLIDQSGSMAEPFAGNSQLTKADGVVRAIHRLLAETINRYCKKGTEIWDYFHIGAIGYGHEVQSAWGPKLSQKLGGRPLALISEIANTPEQVAELSQRQPDGAGGTMEVKTRLPIYFEPVASGGTPMAEALTLARDIVSDFLSEPERRACFPPVIFNITDAEATNPEDAASQLRGLASENGNVLLFNVHVPKSAEKPIFFPSTESLLADEYARQLFRMSSILPEELRKRVRTEYGVNETSRGFIFNGDEVALIELLNVGTPKNLR